jgi:Ca2+-binding EF-hand superfamily protein
VEHAAGAKKIFEGLDADKDGQVTVAEISAAHAKKLADTTARTGTAATPDKPSVTAKAEKSAHDQMSAADMVKKNDTNNDGKLSAAEHAAASAAKFSQLDTNKDGSLSESECEAGEKMKS